MVFRDEIIGYLVAYLEPQNLKEIFNDGNSYGDEVFYAIVDKEGLLLASYGETADTSLLTDDFWHGIKNGAQTEGNWTVFEQQRENDMSASIQISKNGEERIICQYPIADTDWFLVMGLNQKYADYMLGKVWKPTVGLLAFSPLQRAAWDWDHRDGTSARSSKGRSEQPAKRLRFRTRSTAKPLHDWEPNGSPSLREARQNHSSAQGGCSSYGSTAGSQWRSTALP